MGRCSRRHILTVKSTVSSRHTNNKKIRLTVYLTLENSMKLKKERNKFERKLDEYNHTMEFIRTIVPIAVLVLQIVILMKLV